MSELDKYLILENDSLYMLNQEMNNAVSQGYKLNTFTITEIQEDECGRHPQYVAVMSLNELDSKYLGVINLEDVPPSDVDRHLADGWIIASASISTKFVRMVKKEVKA